MSVRKARTSAVDSTVDEDRERPGRVAPRRHLREQINFLAIHEVAEQLGVSTRTVRRWIENMELVAHLSCRPDSRARPPGVCRNPPRQLSKGRSAIYVQYCQYFSRDREYYQIVLVAITLC